MPTSNSFSRQAATASFVALVMISLFLLIGYAANFFLLVFGGILFGVLLSALARLLQKKTKMGYGLALACVMGVLVLVIGGTIWLLAPTVSQQTEELSNSLPKAFERLKTNLSQTSWGKRLLQGLPEQPKKLVSSPKDVFSQLTGVFSSTLGALANVVIVIITGIYLASSPDSYQKGFLKLFTPSFRPRLEEVLRQCFHTLSNWLLSRSISMVVVGIATGIGLALLGIPLPVVLGIIAALLNFIPNLGPYIAVIPALLLAYLEGPDKALYVFLLYMGVQSLEGYLLTPMLDKKLVSTPPALLLFGQVLLGILVGISGVLLASPIIAVLIVLVKELYVKEYLEKKKPTSPEIATHAE